MNDWWQSTFPKGRQSLEITDSNGQSVIIAYGEKGTGKPIILVHGMGTWSYSWRHNIEPLAQQFHVICFDAKGYGFSEKPSYRESSGHQINELQQIIKKLCNEPPIVVSESLGALITLATAESYPELFARLVLMNVPIFPQDLPTWSMRWIAHLPLNLIKTVDDLRLVRLFAPIVRWIVQRGRNEITANGVQTSLEEAYWLTYPYIEFPNAITKFAEDLKQGVREIQCLKRGEPNLISQIQNGLSTITCPTLILWGEQDRWFPVSNGEALHTCIPNSIFQIIPDCGHQAAGGRPDVVNLAILAFLSKTNLM
ncbi:MAG: alpha/beta hydrolase [Scytonematopsis contorta HA4267-MV1]|jgi:pimeloyl-ACP methyl ester carboxylesterase|nr:alpha/beta hydrolase [Scytonematopsis contorta HA4267-MV1]